MLRVFISSTAEDLKAWRLAARDVVLDLQWHPELLNEHGGPDTRPTVAMCRERLASCDLVVLLVAFRRGWVPDEAAGGDGRQSITALELAHARERAVPVLAFLARDSWPGNLWEPTDEGRQWMREFRAGLGQAAGFFDAEGPDLPTFRALLKSALAEHKLALAVAAPSAPPAGPARVLALPFVRNPHFTGRDGVLAALHARLHASNAPTRTAALTGLGGIGKTQTALEFAYRYADEYDVVAWLRAEDPDTLASDYGDLASALHLDAAHASDARDRIRAVREWLDQHDRWLLVFDNAPGAAALSAYRPRVASGHVLVTSRDASWAGVAVASELTPLTVDDAAAFLLARRASDDATSAREIARRLDGLPLALEQACAYAERGGRTLAQYLDLLVRKQVELLRRGEVLDYPATVASTWELSFQALDASSPVAVAVLRLLAWLAPDRTSRSLVVRLAAALPDVLREAADDELAFDDALADLRRSSLVRVEGDALSLHRLVQVITRARMDDTARATWSVAVLHMLESGFDDVSLSADERNELYTHVRSAVDATPGAAAEPILAAGLLARLAQRQRWRGEHQLAVTALSDALATLAAGGQDAGDEAAGLHLDLAEVLCEEGEFDASEAHFAAGTRLTPEDLALPPAFAFVQPARGRANQRWLLNELRNRAAVDASEILVELAPALCEVLAEPDGGVLARELRRMRWRLWHTYGVALPPIALRPRDLPDRTYLVSIDHVPVAGLRLPHDARFVHEQREALDAAGIPYTPTANPLNGRAAAWVADTEASALETAGVVSSAPAFVVGLHVQAMLEARLGSFLSHQDVADLLQIHLSDVTTAKTTGALELTPLTLVIRALLMERVPVRSVPAIVERLRDGLASGTALVPLVEDIRLLDGIRHDLPGLAWNTRYWRLTPATEATLVRRLRLLDGSAVLALEPELTQEFLAAVRLAVTDLPADAGPVAVMVADPAIRPQVRRLIELEFPHLPVVAEREVPDWMRERVIGTIEDTSREDA